MVSYGRKSQFGSIFQFLNARFDVLILQFFVPLASIGYYIVAQFLVELVMVLTRSFQSSVTSLVTRTPTIRSTRRRPRRRRSGTTACSARRPRRRTPSSRRS